MIGPQILKTNSIETHRIKRTAHNIKDVKNVFDFAYGEVYQEIIQTNDQDHPIKCAIQEIFILHIDNKTVNRTESNADISKVVRADFKVIVHDSIAMLRQFDFKILV